LWWFSIHLPQRSQGFKASLLSEVSSDVDIEPALLPVEGEPLQFANVNRKGTWLDVIAWGRNRQCAFF